MTDGLQVVRQFLVDLKVEALIIVDDEWESAALPAVEDVIGQVRSTLLVEDSPGRKRLVAAFDELGLKETGPWDEQLRRRWDDADNEGRAKLVAQLAEGPSDLAGTLAGALPTIASWFGDKGPRLVRLTPRQWDEEGEKLLDDVNGSAICLFDEELHTGRKGTSLMQAALAENRPEDRYFFGLLTATIVRSGEEAQTATVQQQVSSDRVIVLAKDRTTDPAEFADGLRFVVLATYHDSLRSMAKAAIRAALEQTENRLDGLTVSDFDRIVLQTAQREGTWEGGELLRLIGLWERDERRDKMLAERGRIEQILARIRTARPGDGKVELASPRVRELRRLELYASADINRAYLPIELGDVFALDSQEYVLLVQPCDVMVRKRGDRVRDPRVAPLAAITRLAAAAASRTPNDAGYRLEYYVEAADEEAYVDFRKVAFLPLSVLDLATFRDDGRTTIDPSSEAPEGAFAPLRKRHKVLAKEFKEVIADLDAAEGRPDARPNEEEAARLIRLAWAPYRGGAALKLEPARNGHELSFGLRRSGRILPPRATTMLTMFHQYRSRPAFEADFAREYA